MVINKISVVSHRVTQSSKIIDTEESLNILRFAGKSESVLQRTIPKP